jgi:PAS domain S-box-containing protein
LTPISTSHQQPLGSVSSETATSALDLASGNKSHLRAGKDWVLDKAREELLGEIAERQRAEAALRESEQRFRLLVEGVRDYAILMLDPEGHILTWNLGAERIKGYRAAEILGKHFSIFYLDEDVRSGKPQRTLTIATAKGHHEDEGWRIRKDGSGFWASVLITALHDEQGNLRGFSKLTRDITERKRAQESLRELSGRLLNVQDEERRRLARELHDSTAQTLSALSLNLALLNQTARAVLNETAARALAESQSLAEQASREIRTFSYLLHPPMLDQGGLVQALRWYVEGFAQRTRIEVALEILPPEFDRLPPDVEMALFRIVQECLTNIYRHSGSSTATVRLVRDSSGIILRVQDRGKGLLVGSLEWDAESPNVVGVGIRGMRERVRQLGGSMIFGAANPGTVAEVVLPLRRDQGLGTEDCG